VFSENIAQIVNTPTISGNNIFNLNSILPCTIKFTMEIAKIKIEKYAGIIILESFFFQSSIEPTIDIYTTNKHNKDSIAPRKIDKPMADTFG
jgi:hypothetical protein